MFLWGIVEALWNLGPEKPLGVESSMNYSVGAWKIKMLKAVMTMETWLVKFQSEAKTIWGLFCAEDMLSAQLELKNCL